MASEWKRINYDELENSNRFNHAGIYIILKGKKVLYVGQSKLISGRLKGHEKKDKFYADYIIATKLIVDKRKRINLEAKLLNKLKPSLNKRFPGKNCAPRKKHKNWMDTEEGQKAWAIYEQEQEKKYIKEWKVNMEKRHPKVKELDVYFMRKAKRLLKIKNEQFTHYYVIYLSHNGPSVRIFFMKQISGSADFIGKVEYSEGGKIVEKTLYSSETKETIL